MADPLDIKTVVQ